MKFQEFLIKLWVSGVNQTKQTFTILGHFMKLSPGYAQTITFFMDFWTKDHALLLSNPKMDIVFR